MKNLKKVLATIAYQESWTIRAEVVKEALTDNQEYIKYFFKDLAHYGCISWMVWSLVRYSDTHRFFDNYYDEIQEILEELEDNGIGYKINYSSDLKNQLAWLAFEETAYQMAINDLGLEI